MDSQDEYDRSRSPTPTGANYNTFNFWNTIGLKPTPLEPDALSRRLKNISLILHPDKADKELLEFCTVHNITQAQINLLQDDLKKVKRADFSAYEKSLPSDGDVLWTPFPREDLLILRYGRFGVDPKERLEGYVPRFKRGQVLKELDEASKEVQSSYACFSDSLICALAIIQCSKTFSLFRESLLANEQNRIRKEIEGHYSSLSLQYTRLQEDHTMIKGEHKNLHQQYQQVQVDKNDLDRECGNLRYENSVIAGEVQRHQALAEKQQKEYEHVCQENSELRARAQSLQQQMDDHNVTAKIARLSRRALRKINTLAGNPHDSLTHSSSDSNAEEEVHIPISYPLQTKPQTAVLGSPPAYTAEKDSVAQDFGAYDSDTIVASPRRDRKRSAPPRGATTAKKVRTQRLPSRAARMSVP